MVKASLIERLRRRLRELRAANGANVTITFALATIPLIGFVGAAVDYSHANAVKVAMQMATDSTALMLSKTAATLDQSELQTKANDYFRALFTRTDVTDLSVNVVYSTNTGSQITITATSYVPTNFMGLMGFSQLKVGANSLIKWGNTKLRVALVLDTTGSMASAGKIGALQTATKNLLTQLKNAATVNGDVYVSIVPFVKDVNLDPANSNASWIYWDDDAKSDQSSWDALNGTCSKAGNSPRSACLTKGTCSLSSYTTQSTCVAAGVCSNPAKTTQSTCTTQNACSNSSYTTQNSCNNHGGTWGHGTWTVGSWTPATWTPKNHNTWNGCVVDRGDPTGPNIGNYDTNATAPSIANQATLYAAEQYTSCPQASMPLSYDWTTMTALVNSLSANGNTNQGLGLQVGWQSLVGGGPFTVPTMNPNFKYSQVIILLSDGMNTQNRWYTSQTSIDNRQALTCANAKAAGITIYSIQVNTDNEPTSTVLKNCASTSDKFFLLTSANEILTTFDSIGTALSNLRIAQ